jgi:acyl-CoA synthetase (AMP-forming)/AMP-acid ligase II
MTASADASGACPEYPAGTESLLGVLRDQHDWCPDRVLCRRIVRDRRGLHTEPLTVALLVDRAEHAAAALRAAGVGEDDRVILSLGDPHEFTIAFFAALIAGASAVPLPTVAESAAPRSFAARVQSVCASCAPALAVVEHPDRFAGVVGALRRPVALRAPRDLAGTERIALRDRSGATPAFIQYTSGSTGDPKGVVITHANVLANCRAIRDATGYTRADRMVSWLPLHHDMGLVGGLLTSIYCAAETCLMSPLAFLGRPVTWLEAITACAGALTVAPTFAYSLCARKIPDKQLAGIDLSSLRLAYIGAEPIDAATVRAFSERFAAYGLSPAALYPVYGLAEATLAVAFPAPGDAVRCDHVDRRRLVEDGLAVPCTDGTGVTFVSVGRPLPRHRVEIIDPDTGAALADRCVGELVVDGPSISPRYFDEDPATVRDRLHTGDLAYAADGHLFVVDRLKDLVIVGGQNYAPSDIERAAAAVDGVRRGRIVAFSASCEGGEALHVVAEASPDADREPEALADAVRRAVRAEIGLTPASVTIVHPGSLERTSSGKIKRRACAAAHRAGTLRVLHDRAELQAIRRARRRAALAARVRQALGI